MNRKVSKTLKLLLLLVLSLGFNRPSCDSNPPTLTCDTVSLSLNPGECVEIPNPCGNHQWVNLDSFRLCDAPTGVFIQTQRDPRARFVCADTNVAQLVDEPVDYVYSQRNEFGMGQFRITIGRTPLTVVASANPTSIAVGGTSQLNAMVSNGTPPYSYAWTPIGGLSNPNIASPTASPNVTTQYTVIVTDSVGSTVIDSIILSVGMEATATANPSSIMAGGQSQLDVRASGGTPPYSYAWTPAASLNNPTSQSPIAMPSETTEYTVTVTDAVGTTAVTRVQVQVATGAIQACFAVTRIGALFLDLDGSCSTGSVLTYRWWCDFLGAGQPPSSEGPGPTFTCLYEVPGTRLVRLEVLDADGNSSVTTQTVP